VQGTNNAKPRAPEGAQYKTGLPIETIQQVGRQLTNIPDGFNAHPDVVKLLQKRRRMIESADSRVDFSFAELLAFCTLSLRRPKGTAHFLPSRFISNQMCS
jgi:2-oxoglutarate dehydrogenase complex dehydrogenase (E1) component-like enzyme